MRYPTHQIVIVVLATLLGACSAAPTPVVQETARRTAATGAPITAVPATPPPAVVQPTSALPAGGAAPGDPPARDSWMPGDKQAFGTAFTYDQAPGKANPSRVWFTLTNGAITEGLYPDVSQANLKSLGIIVAGKDFVADETTDATYKVERLDGRTPAFRVTSTDKGGRWAVVKEVVADPDSDAICFTVALQALQGQPADYRMFLNYIPRLAQSGAGDLGEVRDGIGEAWDAAEGVYSALASDPPAALATIGYTGVSDLLADLKGGVVDSIHTSTRTPGRLSIAIELPTRGASSVALGFGPSREQARSAATSSLGRGFRAVSQAYMRGWAGYLDRLDHPFPNLPMYEESLVVLKSLEDKTNPGAFVASPATPWGQHTTDENPSDRGARYVSARDLYHIAMALKVAGDEVAARGALAFLDEYMQLPSGGFPARSLPDGTPAAPDNQIDQAALPILLAWHLKATDRYASLVAPAADFITASGPRTAHDRWEENGGYTPATLAAEIAGLVCAADLAKQAGDTASAARYLKVADDWNAKIETWTLTTSGPLGGGTYYLRATNGDPDDGATIDLANGGGAYDRRAIVDLSFLELVRLGLRAADDPNIVATLEVADAALEAKTPKGELFSRYTHDALGESQPGGAPNGHGGPWPLLIGEHSIYDVARTRAEHPASWYLPTMWGMANAGGMLPRQVFLDGAGTGAPTPHGWTHAEYILFAYALKQARVPDMPDVVAQRYLVP
jgi:glucoamylase